MLREWRWHGAMCLHCPAECEGRIPPRPRGAPSRGRAGRLRSQLSGELRDSDGSELIRLCCWCYACFIFGDGCSLYSPSSHLPPPPFSLCIDVPVSIFRCRPLNLIHACSLVICCCEGVLPARGAESTVFHRPTHRGPHLGAADWICGLKHSEAWSIHCEQQHSGPRRFNRRPQRFLFRPIVLSSTGLSHVDVRGCVVLLFVFVCLNSSGEGEFKSLANQITASSS